MHFSRTAFSSFEDRIFLFLEVFVEPFEPPGDLIVVRENQFQLEVGGVAQRVNAAGGVRDGRIVEHADDVGDGVDFAKRCERVAVAVFLHASHVDVLHGGVGDFFWVVELGQLDEPRLGNFGYAHVRALRAGLAFDAGFGEDAEERGFSDLRQSDNSCLHKL